MSYASTIFVHWDAEASIQTCHPDDAEGVGIGYGNDSGRGIGSGRGTGYGGVTNAGTGTGDGYNGGTQSGSGFISVGKGRTDGSGWGGNVVVEG